MSEPTIEVTRDLLNRGRGADGDYSPAQLRILGLSHPLDRGWRSTVIGMRISKEAADEFIELRDGGQLSFF